MSWYSILPAHLTVYETWIIRLSIILAIINFSPWFIAILFDLCLYIVRRIWHEVPYYGGRARGHRRPRATSLKEQMSGRRRRTLSLAGMMGGAASPGTIREDELRKRGHWRTFSDQSLDEEIEEDNTDPDSPVREAKG